jgi:hypothetical protein
MGKLSREKRLQRLLALHGQIFRLLRQIERVPVETRGRVDWGLATRYNRLREQAAKLAPARNAVVAELVRNAIDKQRTRRMFKVLLGVSVLTGLGVLIVGVAGGYPGPDILLFALGCIAAIWATSAFVTFIVWLTCLGKAPIGTIGEIQDQSVLLLRYVRGNIKAIDPNSEAGLPEITIAQRLTEMESTPRRERSIQMSKPSTESRAPAADEPTNLAESEHRHLEIQFREQQRRYDQLTVRIAAVSDDRGRELDSERELILKDRLEKLIDEREQVQTLLKTIEQALNDGQAAE